MRRVLLTLWLATGCLENSNTCRDRETCPPPDWTGGTSGSAGESSGGDGGTAGSNTGATGGSAGSSMGGVSGSAGDTSGGVSGSGASGGDGGTSASGGNGGTGATGGSGGTGGAGGALPCDGMCRDSTPFCHTDNVTCIECRTEDDCEAPTPLCDDTHTCVECLSNEDCTDPSASQCDQGVCTACTSNEHCAHLPGTTVCDLSTNQCVQCTGTDYDSCGVNGNDEQQVCDSLSKTCTNETEGGSNTCQPCVSDAHCPAGRLCVLQRFQDQDVGYFCLFKEGDTQNGAPAECAANGRPYVKQVQDAVSIDDQTANICTLATSTCPARNDFRTTNCAPQGTPDDSLCGFDPTNDAKCALQSGNTYLCTMRCISLGDCPGTLCDTGPLEPVCEL